MDTMKTTDALSEESKSQSQKSKAMKQIDLMPFSDIQTTIIKYLMSVDYATYDKLIFEVYAYNEPEYARNSLATILTNMRKKLKKQGFNIVSSGGGRGNKAKLRLVEET